MTLHEPNEVNQRRARGHRVVALLAPALEQHVGDPLARGSRPRRRRAAPSKASRVASSTLRKPWCSKPSGAACAAAALCSPAVHLNGVSRSSAASIQRGQRRRGAGTGRASSPPVRNFSRSSASATSSAARQPARRRAPAGGARRTPGSRRRAPGPARAASTAATTRRALPARSSRSRSAISTPGDVGHRLAPARCSAPADRAGAAGDHDRERELLVDRRGPSRR